MISLPTISPDDALVVGHTLRAFARLAPQPDVAERLARVGDALVEAARPVEPRTRGEGRCI